MQRYEFLRQATDSRNAWHVLEKVRVHWSMNAKHVTPHVLVTNRPMRAPEAGRRGATTERAIEPLEKETAQRKVGMTRVEKVDEDWRDE